MRKRIGSFAPLLIVGLVLLVVFCLGFVIVGGVAIAAGHLLMRLYPFSLFEATILTLVIAAVTVNVMTRLIGMLIPSDLSPLPAESRADDEELPVALYKRIPTSRFYQTESEKTWETWLRAEIANDIYMLFQDEPHTVSNLDDSQMQELSIHLSVSAIAIVKRKTNVRRLAISMSNLKQELTKQGQRAYDHSIMQLALEAINLNLNHYAPILLNVIRTRGWNEPADVPED